MWMNFRALILLPAALTAACATTSAVDNTKMAEGYYTRGVSYLQIRDYEKAHVEFQRAIKTDPKNKMSYYALGVVSDMQGNFKDAEAYYDEAIDVDSEFSEAHNGLGVVYMKQQKWKEALKSFRNALANKIYPTPHVPHLNMGDVYMAQRDYARAAEAYRESKRFVNQDVTVYKLGMALLESGAVKDAIGELQEGAALSPKNADIRFALALAHVKDGNKKSAQMEFKKVIDLSPGTELARRAQDYLKTLR